MFYQGKNVLVTGGADFIGAHIVQELLKQSARVRIVTNDKQSFLPADKNLEIIQGDLTKQEDCQRAAEGVNFIFHAAGPATGAAATASNPMKSITANLLLTAQILQAAWAKNVERFLLLSSTTGYPAVDYPVKEEEMWNGSPHPSYFGYGWMRKYLEKLSEFVAQKSNVKIAILRLTAVYGRQDDFEPATSHVVSALIRKAAERQDPFVVWGTGEEMRDFIHVNDLVRASLLLLEKYAVCDPVNVGYGKSTKIKEIVKIILKAAGYENAKVVFDASKPSTIPIRLVDISKVEKVIGFRPQVSLEEGLTDTVKWYAQTRGINL